MPRKRSAAALLGAMLILLSSVGCQQSTSGRLVGKWTGHVDSADKANSRKAQLKEKADAAEAPGEAPEDVESSAEPTVLEGVEVRVDLEFESGGRAQMTLDGKEPLVGVWRVIRTIPPDGAEIEIGLLVVSSADAEKDSDGELKVGEKRRFEIEFQPDGDTPGFMLHEKGADPKFGRLYFTKAN